MASREVPSPLPAYEPIELDDDEFAEALAEGSPRADRLVGALDNLSTESVTIAILCLGRDYHLGEITQGYYFVGVRYSRRNLFNRFAAMGRFDTSRAQLALSIALVGQSPAEDRQGVAGWVFKETQ